MKILYCIHSLFNSGGMERIITNKVNYLAQKGFNVFVVTAEQKGRPPFFTLDSSVKCIDLDINYSENTGLLAKMLSYKSKKKKHKRELSKLLFDIRPDIVISTLGNEAFFLFNIKDGSKKILELHFAKNYRLNYLRSMGWHFFDLLRSYQENKIVGKYDRFVVLTNEDKEQWKGCRNIEVIPNFIKRSQDICSELNAKHMIAVGRLTYQKGYDRLIKAWQMVNAIAPDWKLTIYGGGELLDCLKKEIKERELEQNIKIVPPQKNIDDIYLNGSALILSSRYEGLPMVLLEAIAYGLPIISFLCKCGPRDVIDDGITGFLVEDGDLVGLSTSILKVINDDVFRKQLGVNAFKKSVLFSEEIVMEKWINLFKSLLKSSYDS